MSSENLDSKSGYTPSKIQFDEDDVIQAKVRLGRIKAIADSLVTLDREGYTDCLYKNTIGHLMDAIDSQVEEAKTLLNY